MELYLRRTLVQGNMGRLFSAVYYFMNKWLMAIELQPNLLLHKVLKPEECVASKASCLFCCLVTKI